MSKRKRAVPSKAARASFTFLFGRQLRVLRTMQKVSPQELAARMKVGRKAVADYEMRFEPQLSTIVRYVRALGGDVELTAYFADGEPFSFALDDHAFDDDPGE